MRISGVLVALVAFSIGCKERQVAPAAQPGSGTATAAADAAGVASGSAPKDPQVLELPKLSGKPPAKTKTKHTQAEYEKLGKLEYPGWKRDLRRALPNVLDVVHTTEQRPKISVRVTMSACVKCLPMDVEKWRAEKESLRQTLQQELRDKPDTVFEIGEVTVGGAKVMTSYQLGVNFSSDEHGPMGAYSNALTFYFNDGINQIKMVVHYADDALTTKEALVQLVPREHLERIGIAFIDQYLQAWGN